MLALSLMVAAWYMAKKRGYPIEPFGGWGMVGVLFINAIPGIMLIAIIFGGVRSGVFTASESSCVAVVYALLVTVVAYRTMNWNAFVGATTAAGAHHRDGVAGDRLRGLLRLVARLSARTRHAGRADAARFG